MDGRLTPETAAQAARASSFDNDIAKERGRLVAARALIENPEQRKAMEAQHGVVYCRIRWPEVYELEAAHDVVNFVPRFSFKEPADKPDYDDNGILIAKL
jgi:hypothetical protein